MPSHFNHIQLFVTLWTIAHQAPLSMGFSRQEYWSGLPCPPPGNLPNSGIKPESLMSPTLAGRFLTTRPGSLLAREVRGPHLLILIKLLVDTLSLFKSSVCVAKFTGLIPLTSLLLFFGHLKGYAQGFEINGQNCNMVCECMHCACSVDQSCPILCNLMDCSPPGTSVNGIFQARILEWVVISYSRGFSQPRDWTHVSCTGRCILYHWATQEAPWSATL